MFDLFYLSIFGKLELYCCISHFLRSSSILFTLSTSPATLTLTPLTISSIPSILLLLNLSKELFRSGFKLLIPDDLKLL